jgi:hypothetical protein
LQSVLLKVLCHLSTPERYQRLKAVSEKPALAKRIVNADARESYKPNKPHNDAAQQPPLQPTSLQAEEPAAAHAVAPLFGPRGPAASAPAPRSSRTPADLASRTMLPRVFASYLEMLHAMDEAEYDETLGGGVFFVRRASGKGRAKPTLYYHTARARSGRRRQRHRR